MSERRAIRAHDGRHARRNRQAASGALAVAACLESSFSISEAVSSGFPFSSAVPAFRFPDPRAQNRAAPSFRSTNGGGGGVDAGGWFRGWHYTWRPLSRGRKKAGDSCLLYWLRHELDAGRNQSLFGSAA